MRGKRTVWLVGMMGAGKSRVGEALARRLDCRFVDSDAEIERDAGRPIREIFEREGEAAFRVRERQALTSLAGQECVVALGGGAIAQPGAERLLAASGTVVYLRARPETLGDRIRDGAERPLLAGLDEAGRLERLGELLAQRRASYESASLVVDTDGLDVEDVAAEVERRLQEQGEGEA